MITAFFRTVILYLLIIVGLRLMGKRQIGELEPTELVLTILLSDLASIPMQDFGIPLINGIIPIIVVLSLSMLLSWGSLRNIRFREIMCGSPAVIIQDGKLQQKTMLKNRLTVDELMEELRTQGISDITNVKYAIWETNGQLTVLPYAAQSPVTPDQLHLDFPDEVQLSTVIIDNGRVMSRNLQAMGYDTIWLHQTLAAHHLEKPQQVFLLCVDTGGKIVCLPKEDAP
jgi:uncharacterized membrane protein YcaP (DUF421 family)